MLDANSSLATHALQNVCLIVLSWVFLPLDATVLCLSYLLRLILKLIGRSEYVPQHSRRSRTILVTGVGMTKGLALARLFYKAGHRVIGADFEPDGALVPGRVSRALTRFYRLEKPCQINGSARYIQGLLDVILKEKVDLWVSCSGVASAVEDGEAKESIENRTDCRAIQFDIATTQMLHEKDSFMSHTREIGLRIPETHKITSWKAIEDALNNAPRGRKFIMKPIGMNDQARGDMTLLPLVTETATKQHLKELSLSDRTPWIMQQYIHGEEYCTHALVIQGDVMAFVACPSSELLMHYEALPTNSALSQAMLRFTQQYAAQGGDDFTGHLSFDFLVEGEDGISPTRAVHDIALYPIECNPRAHTATALFTETPALVDAYLSLLDEPPESDRSAKVITPLNPTKFYWIGHDLVAYILHPLLQLLLWRITFAEFFRGVLSCIVHLLLWRDGTYELWDPLPWFFLYHIYWPVQFSACLVTGKRWSRVNVSTLKMFEC